MGKLILFDLELDNREHIYIRIFTFQVPYQVFPSFEPLRQPVLLVELFQTLRADVLDPQAKIPEFKACAVQVFPARESDLPNSEATITRGRY